MAKKVANEVVMSSGAAVHAGQLYVTSGTVVVSPISGTVAQLATALGVSVGTITTCNVAQRLTSYGTGLDIFETAL